jgi:hypothetical protein
MKVLLPSTDEQIIKIIPRNYVSDAEKYEQRVESDGGLVEASNCLYDYFEDISNLNLVITKDGTGETETLTELLSIVDGNYLSVFCTFSILSEGSIYFMELRQNSTLLFRDKVYVTSQTNKTQKHTLNTGKYTEHSAAPTGEKYIII